MARIGAVKLGVIEIVLQMRDGYVLGLTNREFRDLISESIGRDVYSDAFDLKGTSKANRLRTLLEIETAEKAGRALDSLMEYGEAFGQLGGNDDQRRIVRELAGQLQGRLVQEAQDNGGYAGAFEDRDISEIDFRGLGLDSSLEGLLLDRLEEALRCFSAECWLSVVFQVGSILEGVLTTFGSQIGMAGPADKWRLSGLIDAASKEGLISINVARHSDGVRQFRNYIHPRRQLLEAYAPGRRQAKIALLILGDAVEGIEAWVHAHR